jgi:glycosyltransferase involved in cell wall biosynthesis
MHIIPEGIKIDAGKSHTETEGCRSSIPTKRLAIGFAGRIVPEKGLHILIDAVARLRSSGKEAECFVAGRFEPDANGSSSLYHAKLRKRVYDLGIEQNVHFLGYVTPLNDFLKKVDIVVVPSLCQDAQPIVLLESMAVGTPVIASRVGGVPEMMTGRLSKWVFRRDDAGEICAKLDEFEALTNSEKHELSSMLRVHATTHYSIEQCHQQLTEAIAPGSK